MATQQIVLSGVLAAMIFTIALDLEFKDFAAIARNPGPVAAGLIAQFALLPGLTFLATLWLDLPAGVEAGMLLVASCPCGSLSNFVTHYGRGNTALSVSITAAANVLALLLTPLNFSWMVASNPTTAAWLTEIEVDPKMIWLSLVIILGIPLLLGLTCHAMLPKLTARIRRPLGTMAVAALLVFIVIAVFRDRHLLSAGLGSLLAIVIAHNALGLSLGYGAATVGGLSVADRRAVTVETGMQNSGLAIGIIGAQFNAEFAMLMVASLWGMWHIVTGFGLAIYWRSNPPPLLQS